MQEICHQNLRTKKIVLLNAVENRIQSSCMTQDLVETLTALLVKDLISKFGDSIKRFGLEDGTCFKFFLRIKI